MQNILKIISFVFLQSCVGFVLSQESTTTLPPFSYIADLKNDTRWPWSMADSQYEDWFFYYDNLTTSGLTDFSKEYFKNVSLTSLESADGVWVAFYSNSSPIFGDDFPFFGFSANAQRLQNIQITYYVYGDARIRLEEGQNHTISKPEVLEWKTYSRELNTTTFTLWLEPFKEGDFVVIDKIIVQGPEIITTTQSTSTSPPLSTSTGLESTTVGENNSSSVSTQKSEPSTSFTTETSGNSSGVSFERTHFLYYISLMIFAGSVIQANNI